MAGLKLALQEIYYHHSKEYISPEEEVKGISEDIKRFSEKKKAILERFVNNNIRERDLKKLIIEALKPENISSGVRAPIEVKVQFSRYDSDQVKFKKQSGFPVITINLPKSLYDSFDYKTKQNRSEDIITVYKLISGEGHKYFNIEEEKNKLKEYVEKELLKILSESGFKYKIRNGNSGHKWALIDMDKTKEENISSEFKEVYKLLKEVYY